MYSLIFMLQQLSLQSNLIVVITVVIAEKMSEEKASTILTCNYSSSTNPVQIIQQEGKPILVRWTSSELDNNSKTELIADSSVGVRVQS